MAQFREAGSFDLLHQKLILFYSECVSLCDSCGSAKTCKCHVIMPHVLHLDVDVQLSVLVPNLVLGAAKYYNGRERAFETKRRLLVIDKLKAMLQSMEKNCE